MTKKTHIYEVHFPNAVNGKQDHYFSSLTAIYTVFTVEQIGCGIQHLWNKKVADGIPYEGKKCRITKEELTKPKRKERR